MPNEKKGPVSSNMEKALIAGLPVLVGALFGGSRGGAMGGQVGLKALGGLQEADAEQVKLESAEAMQESKQAHELQKQEELLAFKESESEKQRDFLKKEESKKLESSINAEQQKVKSSLSKSLRREYEQEEITKATSGVFNAWNKIRQAANNPSAAGDISLTIGYMKMLDPGSVVREGEFATAQNAAGVPERIRNIFNRFKKGERLSPDQRKDFLNQSKNILAAQIDSQKAIDERFIRLSTEGKINPDLVINKELVSAASKDLMTPRQRLNALRSKYAK